MPMRQHAGYLPAHGKQILQSAMCGTCHTLITETLDPDGTPTGHQIHEQSAYLEWRNSIYNDEVEQPGEHAKSCQACHVPTTDVDGEPIQTQVARAPGGQDFAPAKVRSPYGRHTFVGGNTMLAQLLRDNPMELEVFASKDAFNATIHETRSLLQNNTATITIGEVKQTTDGLSIPVRVQNLAGHKLPTGFPSRRVWVRLVVADGNGQVLFASGQFDEAGQITDDNGNVLESELPSGPVQPHHARIDDSTKVQIYESVMADKNDQTTFTLLRGARYLKDNRLLPRGWQSKHPDAAATMPAGVAESDDFGAGEDSLLYDVPVTADGELTIRASLHYQSIGVRHVREVFQFDTPEVRDFKRMYEAVDRTPETLCKDVRTVQRGS
jgi:hypothetical protein